MKKLFARKNGQAALEYLITYGWAFAVILAAIGVLGYFGLLNPTRYVPESCEFGEQLKCMEHSVLDNGTIELRFRNNFGTHIELFTTYEDASASSSLVIPKGEVRRFTLVTNREIFEGTKERFDIVIEYGRNISDAPHHNISGSLYAKVSDAVLLG